MNYVKEIFERANLQNIRSFLLNGTESVHLSEDSYEERISEAGDSLDEFLSQKFSDKQEREEICGEIYNYEHKIQSVYTEIGTKCGAYITLQLLKNFLPE